MGKQKRAKFNRRVLGLILPGIFAELAPIYFEADHFDVTDSLATTRVFIEVMAQFRLKAKPLATEMVAMNPVFASLLIKNEGPPKSKEQMDTWIDAYGAWSVGTSSSASSGKGYPFHLVAVLGDWLVDASLGHYARPTKNLRLPPVLVAGHSGPGFLSGLTPLEVAKGGSSADSSVISYLARPKVTDYKYLGSFARSPHNLEMAEKITKAINEHLLREEHALGR